MTIHQFAMRLLKCVSGFLEKGLACVTCRLQHVFFSLSYTHGTSAQAASPAFFLAPPPNGLQHWRGGVAGRGGGPQQTSK